MSSRFQKRAFGALTLLTLSTSQAFATNGYFTHGVGTHNKATAGAGMASPSQAIDASTNPASGVLLDERWDIGVALFSPRREYTASPSLANGNGGAFTVGPGTVESDSNWFPIPFVSKNWRLSESRALTMSFYGRGGMNTDYNGGSATFDPDGPGPAPVTTFPGPFGGGETGVDLSQAFLELAYSFKTGPVAIGVAPVLAVQWFEAKGLGAFAPFTTTFNTTGQLPTKLTNNGYDWSVGVGAKVGATWVVNEAFSVSFAHQTRTFMTDFDDYADLFAEGGSFNIPSSTRAGISVKPFPALTLSADVEYTRYSNIDSVGTPFRQVFNCPALGGTNPQACAGGAQGFGFGWDDVFVAKFGAVYKPATMNRWTFRAGYSQANQPISGADTLVNILAPGVIERHFTGGVTYERPNGHEVNLSFMFAPESSVRGVNAFDPTQTLELSMKQFEIDLGYSW